MIAQRIYRLAGLAAAAAILSAAAPVAAYAATPAQHAQSALALTPCPNGTNWNSAQQACM